MDSARTILRKCFLVVAVGLTLTGVAAAAPATAAPGDGSNDTTAPAAPPHDTAGGWVPDGQELSPFDLADPAVSRLDPTLLAAIERAARAAAVDGVTLGLTSGWRSPQFQQQLFDDAVARYGSVAVASQYVASPQVSKHVVGKAVDIGPTEADNWLLRNGTAFGLCQIYANEIWHFELASDYGGGCPPLRPNAAG
ncbi:peptidase M15 [Mycobacterium asiaticum]|uniref:Peptidase M15 n=1 Tax=Mycobacterium asiaticum TaxID=1790 RepID=A0A1A3P5K1_MYCAS|nr:M15 family metallopeptidase [Mycobacterium asiaticum]OBK28950.1 peptidase M15 [Mycobacterium asiaticum]